MSLKRSLVRAYSAAMSRGGDFLARFGVHTDFAGAAQGAPLNVLPGLDGCVELAVEAA